MKYSTEMVMQVWNDDTGERVEIGPDRDSLGLVEIRSYEGRELNASIRIAVNGAKQFRDALTVYLDSVKTEPTPD